MLKIIKVTSQLVRIPIDNTLVSSIPAENAWREFVTVEISTDQGIIGIGLTTFGGPLAVALKKAVDALGELIIGENPIHVESIAELLRRKAGYSGPGGIFTLALSALDIALWDIKGKAFGQSVCSLIGGYRDRMPTYASGALMRSFPGELLGQISAELVENGFTQMKTQLGGEHSIAHEIERISAIRDSIGFDVQLMCDINQLWRVEQAVAIGHQLEPYRLSWLEDPIAHDDYQGLATVRNVLNTPIAGGEYVYGINPFRQMLEAGSVDIVMIDLFRVGGITQWLKVAALAEAFNLPVVSHLLPEIQVHLMAGIPNGLTVEYMPWTIKLFEETPKLSDGQIIVPDKPGLGLTYDKDVIQEFAIE